MSESALRSDWLLALRTKTTMTVFNQSNREMILPWSVCLGVRSVKVNKFAVFFNCATVGRHGFNVVQSELFIDHLLRAPIIFIYGCHGGNLGFPIETLRAIFDH